MFTKSDYEKLSIIMDESPEKKELLSKLLASHQMTISRGPAPIRAQPTREAMDWAETRAVDTLVSNPRSRAMAAKIVVVP